MQRCPPQVAGLGKPTVARAVAATPPLRVDPIEIDTPVIAEFFRTIGQGLLLFAASVTVGLMLRFALIEPTPDSETQKLSAELLKVTERSTFRVAMLDSKDAPTKAQLASVARALAPTTREQIRRSPQPITDPGRQVTFVSAVIRSQFPKHPNPEPLARTIVKESHKAGYDPILVAAVIRSESMFKSRAVSHAGARGLMQIMPATGQYVAGLHKVSWKGAHELNDPVTNVRLGIAYLKYLEQMYNGNRERVLIAYNWGPGNLNEALSGSRRVPQECVHYAKKIIAAHKKWSGVFTQFAARIQPTEVTVG